MPPQSPPRPLWALRIAVALACVGYWRQLALLDESPLLEWLNSPVDVGGLGWSETAALAATRACGWLTLGTGWIALVRPSGGASLGAAVAPLLSAWAAWRLGEGFAMRCDWLPAEARRLFPFVTHSARAAAPWGLWALEPWLAPRPLGPLRVSLGMRGLQAAIAAAFAAHGIEAWQLNPEFVDLLIGSSDRMLGWSMSQSLAENLLRGIAITDVTTALLCVALHAPWKPWGKLTSGKKLAQMARGLWWWMAIWGAVTAASRLTAYGFDLSWHQTLIRASHAGIPLVLLSAAIADLAVRKLD